MRDVFVNGFFNGVKNALVIEFQILEDRLNP